MCAWWVGKRWTEAHAGQCWASSCSWHGADPEYRICPFKESRASLHDPLALKTWLSHCHEEGGTAAGVDLEALMVEDMLVGVVLEGGGVTSAVPLFNCLFSEGGMSS